MKNHYSPKFSIRLIQIFILATCCFINLTKVSAQLFTRTTFNTAYIPISAGSGATVSTATGDNVNQSAISLGFNFNYAGINYTTIGLNTNGLLWFDAASPSVTDGTDNGRLHRNIGTNQSIAPWWSDLTDDISSDILSNWCSQSLLFCNSFCYCYRNNRIII